MSILWTEYGVGREVKRTWETHRGLVVGPEVTHCEKVMSDIYANVTYCQVWNPTMKTVESVPLGTDFECCFTFGVAEVDADESILKEIKRQEEASRQAYRDALEARLQAEQKERALRDWHTPQKGMRMQVVRGHKVPKGTIGVVFWLDNICNPTRVGLATSQVKVNGRFRDVAWVDAAYLMNMKPHPEYDAQA